MLVILRPAARGRPKWGKTRTGEELYGEEGGPPWMR